VTSGYLQPTPYAECYWVCPPDGQCFYFCPPDGYYYPPDVPPPGSIVTEPEPGVIGSLLVGPDQNYVPSGLWGLGDAPHMDPGDDSLFGAEDEHEIDHWSLPQTAEMQFSMEPTYGLGPEHKPKYPVTVSPYKVRRES